MEFVTRLQLTSEVRDLILDSFPIDHFIINNDDRIPVDSPERRERNLLFLTAILGLPRFTKVEVIKTKEYFDFNFLNFNFRVLKNESQFAKDVAMIFLKAYNYNWFINKMQTIYNININNDHE